LAAEGRYCKMAFKKGQPPACSQEKGGQIVHYNVQRSKGGHSSAIRKTIPRPRDVFAGRRTGGPPHPRWPEKRGGESRVFWEHLDRKKPPLKSGPPDGDEERKVVYQGKGAVSPVCWEQLPEDVYHSAPEGERGHARDPEKERLVPRASRNMVKRKRSELTLLQQGGGMRRPPYAEKSLLDTRRKT